MDRITINLDIPIGKKLRARAKNDKRSVSDYVCLLVEQDLRAAGLLASAPVVPVPAAEARFLSQLRANGAPVLSILQAAAELEELKIPVLPHLQAIHADGSSHLQPITFLPPKPPV